MVVYTVYCIFEWTFVAMLPMSIFSNMKVSLFADSRSSSGRISLFPSRFDMLRTSLALEKVLRIYPSGQSLFINLSKPGVSPATSTEGGGDCFLLLVNNIRIALFKLVSGILMSIQCDTPGFVFC